MTGQTMKNPTTATAGAALLAAALGTAVEAQTPSFDNAAEPSFRAAAAAFAARAEIEPIAGPARNVILFVADGMGVTAATAARIHEGQQHGADGEENFLAFERFPHTALVKTYAADAQIPDSAATASAMQTGMKTNNGVISLPPQVARGNCKAALEAGAPQSLADAARAGGKALGIVTTTIVQDATPASVYAHSADRGWVFDAQMPQQAREAGCVDITRQLLDAAPEVVMGGGRLAFLPNDAPDPEAARTGLRADGRNLIAAFQAEGADYAWNAKQLADLDPAGTDRLLGLFSPWSMVFEDPAASAGNPSLAQMTAAAIDVLDKRGNGFFLLVEHEGTDDLQHRGVTRRTLEAIIAFAEAVRIAQERTDPSDTLILVTADHSQPMVMMGNPAKGNPILGLARDAAGNPELAADNKPYTTLGFYAGPGAVEGPRPNPADADILAPDYRPQALIPMRGVPHSGEDVALYAIGPTAHRVGGVFDQTMIYPLIRSALGS